MTIKIGSASSNKGVEILSADATAEQIRAQFAGFSDTELFEAILMLEHILLKLRRKRHQDTTWIARLEAHLEMAKDLLSSPKRDVLMTVYGFRNAFEANHYGMTLLFPWFR